jgi:HEAT repeat protein
MIVLLLSSLLVVADPPDRQSSKQITDTAESLHQSVTVLKERLKDPNEQVRLGAAHALATISAWSVGQPVHQLAEVLRLDPSAAVCTEAALALFYMGPAAKPAVPALIDALGDEDEHLRVAAMSALAAIGPDARDAVPALVRLLHSSSRFTVGVSAQTLEAIGPDAKAAMPALLDMLKAPDEETKGFAMRALIEIAPATAIPLFMEILHDKGQRKLWATTIAAMAVPEAKPHVPFLMKLLKQQLSNHDKKEATNLTLVILRSLQFVGPEAKDAVPLILEFLPAPEAAVRMAVLHTIMGIGPGAAKAVPQLLELPDEPRQTFRPIISRALAAIGPAALPATIAAARSGSIARRRVALEALKRMGPVAKEAIPLLKQIITTENDRFIRELSADALAHIQPARARYRHLP